MYIYMYMYICLSIYLSLSLYISISLSLSIYIYIYIYIYTYVYMYIYIYTYIYIYIYVEGLSRIGDAGRSLEGHKIEARQPRAAEGPSHVLVLGLGIRFPGPHCRRSQIPKPFAAARDRLAERRDLLSRGLVFQKKMSVLGASRVTHSKHGSPVPRKDRVMSWFGDWGVGVKCSGSAAGSYFIQA